MGGLLEGKGEKGEEEEEGESSCSRRRRRRKKSCVGGIRKRRRGGGKPRIDYGSGVVVRRSGGEGKRQKVGFQRVGCR